MEHATAMDRAIHFAEKASQALDAGLDNQSYHYRIVSEIYAAEARIHKRLDAIERRLPS